MNCFKEVFKHIMNCDPICSPRRKTKDESLKKLKVEKHEKKILEAVDIIQEQRETIVALTGKLLLANKEINKLEIKCQPAPRNIDKDPQEDYSNSMRKGKIKKNNNL